MRQGILRSPTTRAYTLQTGEVISNREMQQRAMTTRFGSDIRTLEARADAMAQAGYRSAAGVKSHWVRGVMRTQPWARRMTYRQVERDPRFADRERGIYAQWKYYANKRQGDKDAYGRPRSKAYWQGKRFDWLKRYGVIHLINGEWIS